MEKSGINVHITEVVFGHEFVGLRWLQIFCRALQWSRNRQDSLQSKFCFNFYSRRRDFFHNWIWRLTKKRTTKWSCTIACTMNGLRSKFRYSSNLLILLNRTDLLIVVRQIQGFYFPEKRHGHVMCTGRLNSDYGVFMFGGYGHTRFFSPSIISYFLFFVLTLFEPKSESNMADLWFLRANMSSAFNAPTVYTCSMSFTTVHVHVILMFVGWFVFLNGGIFMARYGRAYCSSWLKIHAVLQVYCIYILCCIHIVSC